MTEKDIIARIYGDIPPITCEPGCVECCTVALWSPYEWNQVPLAERQLEGRRLGVLRIPMRGPCNSRLLALLPVRAEEMMGLAARPKLALTEVTDRGILLMGFGLDGVKCPFAAPGEGCSIYEHRPFTCRIFGMSGEPGPMSCHKWIAPAYVIPESIIMQRWLLWTNLLQKDPHYNKATQAAEREEKEHDCQSI